MKRALTIIMRHLFLWIALVCVSLSLLPVRPGILIPVHRQDQQMIYINDAGAVVHPGPWLYAGTFDDKGMSHVTNSEKNCYQMNRSGKASVCPGHIHYSQIHPDHLPLGPDSQGMILLRNPGNNRWVLANQQPAFPGTWDEAHPFQGNQAAAVCKNGYWGFIDRTGKKVLPYVWDEASSYDESGVARVCRHGKWGIIDAAGNWIVRPHYRELSEFDAQGLAAATSVSSAGFINREGKIVIPLRYETVEPFDAGGLAKVVKITDWTDRLVGWIDRKGNEVIPCRFPTNEGSWFYSFAKHPKLLAVQEGHRSGLIDRKGNWVVPLGDGDLRLIKDPMAPEREWYARIPGPNYGLSETPISFQPGCYDEQGRIIWSGSQITWRKLFRYAGYILLGCWLLVFVTRKYFMNAPRIVKA
jgi:hypothetical protein